MTVQAKDVSTCTTQTPSDRVCSYRKQESLAIAKKPRDAACYLPTPIPPAISG